jgi:hypothetical protein
MKEQSFFSNMKNDKDVSCCCSMIHAEINTIDGIIA